MPIRLNRKGERWARNAIKRGAYNTSADWGFSAADADVLLGDPANWKRYANFSLGLDTNTAAEATDHYEYPHAKMDGARVKVYRAALRAIRRRAEKRDQTDIFESAGRLLEHMDNAQGRSGRRRAYLGVDETRRDSQTADGGLVFDASAGIQVDSESRGDGEGAGTVITGYAAVFDVLSTPMPWGHEKIAKGAFARAIKQRADVIANLEHEGGLNVLGRVSNKTLTLREDDHGLRVEFRPPDTSAGRDAITLVKGGFLRQMSFMFAVKKQELEETDEGLLRTLVDVDLYDVAIVAFAAYPQTSVKVRAHSARSHERRLRLLTVAAA
ncbi:MAG: HK97 family phage prohead protease [Planctomycetota bacterium]|jgi:HK97 family phage prohead protease